MRTLIILLLGLTILSYNQSQAKHEKTFTLVDTIYKTDIVKDTVIDRITKLLDKALMTDTLESYTNKPFLFFKSGHLISKTEKNALAVVCPTDTTYTIRLYSIQNNRWFILDSISKLDAFPIQFEAIFDDYNFDGQTDIYIQVSISNGWPLSTGHLIIVDPNTKKFNLHKEARDYANMTLDRKNKTVKTESCFDYGSKGRHQLIIYTYKWVNGHLKTISKKKILLNEFYDED